MKIIVFRAGPSNTEAYGDALPPKPSHHHLLTTYSDACWSSQLGYAVQAGIQLTLFKFRSMSGAIIFRSGGSLTWKTEQQERTSLSSCDAKICTTNAGCHMTKNFRNTISHLSSLGYPITDADLPSWLGNPVGIPQNLRLFRFRTF